MKRFEIFDSKSDIGIIAYGKNREEIVKHLIIGYYSLITDIDKIKIKQTVHINLTGEFQYIIMELLNELIYKTDVEQFIGRDVEVRIDEKDNVCNMSVFIKGEKFDRNRHESGFLIKAATYYNNEETDKYIKIVFDI